MRAIKTISSFTSDGLDERVNETTRYLIAAGYQVFVVEDAIASRNKQHKALAIKQLSAAGAIVTCAESVLFQWLEKAGTTQFRTVLQLIK